MAPGGIFHVKANVRPGDVGPRQLRSLDALDFFLAGHHLRGARAGREARDEFIELGDFLFAHGVFGFDARADLRLGQDHVVVAAGVHDHRLVVDVRGVRADAVQKMAVVRDDDQHARGTRAGSPAASGRNRGPGGSSVRRAAAPPDCRTGPAPAARGLFDRPAVRSSCARAASTSTPRPSSRMAASASAV